MQLRYTQPGGKEEETIVLKKDLMTLGRSTDADIVIEDERASRIHCGIEWIDGAFHLKDLKSKNGTFLNGERVQLSPLRHGDRIRLGSSLVHVEEETAPGADTAVNELQQAMSDGKGYGTILREILHDADRPAPRPPKS